MKIEDLPKSEYNGVRVITNTDACKFIGCGHDYLLVYTRRERSHIKLEPSEDFFRQNREVLFRREGFVKLLGISCKKYFNKFQQLIDGYFDNNLIKDTPASLPAEIFQKESEMKEVMTISGVHAYLDADGTAWLNAEDVARGLGFIKTEEKLSTTNGRKEIYESIRWARVNDYLAEFGYSHKVGKEDFLPENIFYRLAMKAKNEVAEKFQAKVADDILPTIRKTGMYQVKNSPTSTTPKMDEIAQEVTAAAKIYENYFGLKPGMAFVHTISQAEIIYGIDLSPTKRLAPPAEHDTGYMNATQLGEKVGKSPQEVNRFLEKIGLQFKSDKDWILTERGKEFAEYYPYTNNGHSGYQIRFNNKVLPLFNVVNSRS